MVLSPVALAQTDQSLLVRPLGAADLNSNLARLASNPRDVSALIGAGEAALALDDPRAAAGFYARADAIESGNGRIKAGLGRVMLKLQNPAQSLILFDQAKRLGYPETTILADRGLARDMTGDQAGAQKDYQAALLRTPDDAETIRRYAASLGISGQVEASDRVMQPLFYKSDRAAWRYRAFILAMNNRQADAQKIALQTMPAQLAAAITPYMQKMPYLTPAQKAAAVHFGHFPAKVGATIVAVIPTAPAPGSGAPAMASTSPTVIAAAPAKTPARRETASDRRARRAEEQRQRREATRLASADTRSPVRTATTSLPITRAPMPSTQSVPMPAPTPSPTLTPVPTPTRQATAPMQTVQSTPTPSSAQPVRQATAPDRTVQGPPAPGFESVASTPRPTPPTSQPTVALAQASVPSSQPPATTPPASTQPIPTAPPVSQQPDPQATRTLADIIRAIDVPASERQSAVAAVDLTEIQALQAARRAERKAAAASEAEKVKKAAAAKAKAEADAKAKKEAEEKKRLAANPSRNWLQIGVGSSKSALAFTMKGLRKKYDSLNAQDAWSASWGRTNRLLVGPFASFTRAKAVEDKIKAGGGDAFAWKSDAGEVVERLGAE